MDEAVKVNIISACRSEQAQEIQTILMSQEIEPRYCKVAMFEACRVGNVDIVEYLLHGSMCSSDSLVNCTDENGETPLHIASKQLNVKVCRAIIQTRVCNLNIQSISGQTPLHLAIGAENGAVEAKLEIICLLLSVPACDPHVADTQGVTPLQIAHKTNNEIFITLLEKGCTDEYTKVEEMMQQAMALTNNKLFHLIITSKRTGSRLVQCILRTLKSLPLHESVASTLLTAAVRVNNVEAVELLLKYQYCDPNMRTEAEGDTPLILACKLDLIDIVNVLVCNGDVDVNVQNYEGNTALHCALTGQFSGAVSHLHHCTKSNLTNRLGETPLHIACAHLNVQAVGHILKNRHCDVNLQTFSGQTPLHLAVGAEGGEIKSKLKIIYLLLTIPDCDANIRNSDGDTPLIVACRLRNYLALCVLTTSKNCRYNPKIQNNDGNTALHFAAAYASKNAASKLIFCSRNHPDISNKLGETPLHIACSELNAPTVEVLLNEGRCDVNAQTNSGQTPLHLALTAKPTCEPNLKESVVSLLLQVPGCDPHIADVQGVTPLQLANKEGTDSLILLLLQKGCEQGYSKTKQMIEQATAFIGDRINNQLESSSSGDNVLLSAIKGSNVEAVETLLEFQSCDPNVRNAHGDTPLIIACKKGDIKFINTLLRHGSCDLCAQNNDGNTALHFAAVHGSKQTMSTLVCCEMYKPDIPNKFGETPLQIACSRLNIQAIRVLLEVKCGVNAQTSNGQTPLHLSITAKLKSEPNLKESVVGLLLKVPSCDPHIADTHGVTPLQLAHEAGTDSLIVLLLQKGCEQGYSKTKQMMEQAMALMSDNLLDLVARKGGFRTFQCILTSFFNPDRINDQLESSTRGTLLFSAIKGSNVEAVDMLLEFQGCDLNVRNADGDTPLMIACKMGNMNIINTLLKNGKCDLGAQNNDGNTTLHLAVGAENGKVKLKMETMQLVLDIPDCDPNIRNSDGDTPLIVACKLVNHQPWKCVQVILSLLNSDKCDPNIQNDDGNTALHFAAVQSSQVTMEMLVHHKKYIPDLTNKHGETPLHFACTQLNEKAITLFLREGKCNINAQTITGETPLHLVIAASKLGGSQGLLAPSYKRIIRILLSSGHCNPTSQDIDGNTALHLAAAGLCQSAMQELVCCTKYKSDLTNKLGQTPLHISCLKLSIATIEVLLKKGDCSVNAQTSTGQTPLHLVLTASMGREPKLEEDITQLLLSIPECDPHIADAEGVTPLQIVYKTNIKVFMLILDFFYTEGYCKREQVIDQAMTLTDNKLLHLLVRWKKTRILQCILKSFNSLPTIVNKPENGITPLVTAIRCANVEVVKLLLSCHCCDPNVKTGIEGNTPLITACKMTVKRCTTALQIMHILLLNEMCSPNTPNNHGNTALHFAAAGTSQKAVDALVQHDSYTPDLTNNQGETPLHIACTNHQTQAVTTFLKFGRCNVNLQTINGQTPLHLVLASHVQGKPEHTETIAHLLLNVSNCDPHIIDSQGTTPLMLANNKSNVELLMLMLEKGCAEGYSKTEEMIDQAMGMAGGDLFHLVIHSKKTRVVQCILNNLQSLTGIINKTEAASGDTPLGIAVKEGSSELVELLLQSQHCDPNVRTGSDGNTPLILACKTAGQHQGQKSLQVILALLSSTKCDLNLQDFEGNTALHYAASGDCQQTVNALVCDERYQPDVANKQGQIPLHVACSNLNLSTAMLILKDGRCNINLQTNSGQTPLHLAIGAEDEDPVSKELLVCLLLSNPDCDPHIADAQDVTPIRLACNMGEINLYRPLLEKGCTEAYPKKEHMIQLAMELTNSILLHLSCYWESTIIVHSLLRSEQLSAPSINVPSQLLGGTPLQISILLSNVPITAALLSFKLCDPNIQNSDGQTPLCMAVEADNFNIVEALLLNERCDPSLQNSSGETALHIAVSAGKQDIAVALLHNDNCDPNIQNSSDETPLHIACKLGNFDIVTALTGSKHCDINIPDNSGRTALHRAIHHMIPGQLSIINHLIADGQCDLTACDFQGNTALHYACSKAAWRQDKSTATIIRMLLSTGKVNPQCVNNAGETPIQLAISNHEVVHMLFSFSKAQLDHPVQTFVKIFVVGNAETGKSSLVESVCADAFIGRRFVPSQFKTVKGVKPHTAGIIPIPVNNRHFGNAVIYDFAGQHQYYSSHAAVLENLVLSSPPVFLLTINLSEHFDLICETVAYWWCFIGSYTTRSSSSPHVIIVGSHKDVVKSRGEKVQEIQDRLLATIKQIPASFTLVGCVTLDCRKVASEGLTNLLSMLKQTCETVRRDVKIDLRCHILSSFLADTMADRMTCTLANIIASIKEENSSLLPQSTSDLVNLLAALSDKDRILLLKNSENFDDSWIILQRQKIFGDINGSIFAPENFDEYVPDFAGITGIVPVSKINNQFPQYPLEVITGFLSHLQFCFKIGDAQTLKLITTEESDFALDEEFYFFPALISCDNPLEENVWDPTTTNRQLRRRYGWLYECAHRYQYLMSRFLHVLILRLAFSYALAMEHEPSHTLPVICRRCSVWKRGIAWKNNDGIETVVEVGQQNQWVVVMMQCPVGMEAECTQLRRSVIKTVLDAKQDFCPEVTMSEYLMHPGITDYPFQRTKQLALYSMKEVCKVMIKGKAYVLDKAGMHQSALAQLIPCEPYIGFGMQLIAQLFVLKYAQEVITDHSLCDIAQKMMHSNPDACQHKLKLFASVFLPSDEPLFPPSGTSECADQCLHLMQKAKPMTFEKLSKMLDKFSILCGRNPWDISGLSPPTEVLKGGFIGSELRQCLEQMDDSLLGIDSLFEVRTEVAPAVGHSASLGLALGLSQAPTLQVIQHNWPDDVAFQLTEIMAAWLQKMGNSSWRSLAKALLDPAVDCPVVACAIMEQHTKDCNSVEPSDDSKAVDGATLTESFPGDILPAVVQGGHLSWFHLGLVLGLHYGTLKTIQSERSSHAECVAVVITKWLNQMDSVRRRGQPSWRVLARALAHPLVGQCRLADDIARDHPAQKVSGNVSLPEPASLHSSESPQRPMHPYSPSPSPLPAIPPPRIPTPPPSSHSSSPPHSPYCSQPSSSLPQTSSLSTTPSPPHTPSLSNQ